MKDVPNFVNDLPRELTPKPFLMGSQMKLWILSDKMGVLEAIGWDAPNFIKDVPNFVKDVPRILK